MLNTFLRLGSFLMVTQFTTTAYSHETALTTQDTPSANIRVNYQVLEIAADTCFNQVWDNRKLTPDKIKERLNFLIPIDPDDVQYWPSYKLNHLNNLCKEDFQKVYNRITREINKPKLSNFASKCQKIYQAEGDPLTKAAAQLLLEEVAKRYCNLLKRIEERRKMEDEREHSLPEQDQPNTQLNPEDIFNAFFKIKTEVGESGSVSYSPRPGSPDLLTLILTKSSFSTDKSESLGPKEPSSKGPLKDSSSADQKAFFKGDSNTSVFGSAGAMSSADTIESTIIYDTGKHESKTSFNGNFFASLFGPSSIIGMHTIIYNTDKKESLDPNQPSNKELLKDPLKEAQNTEDKGETKETLPPPLL